jgi:hypothetical protein
VGLEPGLQSFQRCGAASLAVPDGRAVNHSVIDAAVAIAML